MHKSDWSKGVHRLRAAQTVVPVYVNVLILICYFSINVTVLYYLWLYENNALFLGI